MDRGGVAYEALEASGPPGTHACECHVPRPAAMGCLRVPRSITLPAESLLLLSAPPARSRPLQSPCSCCACGGGALPDRALP